jgi:hypothetical protein
MNKRYGASLTVAVFLLLPIAASAGPFVTFPTGDAAWSVNITYTNSSVSNAPPVSPPSSDGPPPAYTQNAAASRKATKVEVTLLNNVKRTVITWSDAKTSERWTIPNLPVVFEGDPRDDSIASVRDGGSRQIFDSFSLSCDEDAFSWLKPEFLQGKTPVSYQDKQCFHYLGSVALPGVFGNNHISVKREAWIDSKTLLPVALRMEMSLSVFIFQEKPPVGPLVLPPKYKKAVDYYKAVMGYP